ncbi:MAG: hypothetical protein K2M64_00970 [Clostridia bacterium]|nr:hypothetical protein [Clostridia bacterium]
MKFPVMNENAQLRLKILAPLALAILLVVNIVVPIKATFRDNNQLIAVTLVLSLFTVSAFVVIIICMIIECASVTIDEQGITMRNGKLVLKHFTWEQVKRIEKVDAIKRNDVLIILNRKKESSAFRRGSFYALSVGRHYIALDFSKDAVKALRKRSGLIINNCRK